MLKIAARTFDVYDDAHLLVARQMIGEVGSVKVAERDVVENLHDWQFGLVMKTAGGVTRRRFPLHDADSVKLSRAYADRTCAGLPASVRENIEAKLACAEQEFGLHDHAIEADISKEVMHKVAYVDMTTLESDPVKVSHKSEAWGLNIGGQNYFPLHDETLVKTAADRFKETSDGLEAHERFAYARNISARAGELGVKIAATHAIHNYTNNEVNTSVLAGALDERKRAMKSAGLGTEVVDQLATAAGCPLSRGDIESDDSWQLRTAKLASGARLSADKVVQTLEGIDKLAGFGHADYMRGMADPYAACFKLAEAESPLLVDGIDLGKISDEALAESFDGEFIAEFRENPVQIYKSLPDPTKAIIRGLAETGANTENAGAVPLAKNVSAGGGDPQHSVNPSYSNGGIV